jgi:hypothetical protein
MRTRANTPAPSLMTIELSIITTITTIAMIAKNQWDRHQTRISMGLRCLEAIPHCKNNSNPSAKVAVNR